MPSDWRQNNLFTLFNISLSHRAQVAQGNATREGRGFYENGVSQGRLLIKIEGGYMAAREN